MKDEEVETLSATQSTKLDWQGLLAEAERRTGLSDWGGSEFHDPFRMLVESLRNEGDLTPVGLERSREYLLQRLEQRLGLFADRKRYPGITEERIEMPIFVTGMPRAGTTFMHGLLGADPQAIAPLCWQLLSVSPPPNLPGIDHDATFAEVERFASTQFWSSPDFAAAHDCDLKSPEECPFLFELSFVSNDFTGWWNVPGYHPVLGGSFASSYAIHHKCLQAMQYGTQGRRWVLKAPEHSAHLPDLLAEYPDAVIVQHHRDPAKVIASMLKVLDIMHKHYSDKDHMGPDEARRFVAMYAGAVDHVALQRQRPEINARVVDVHYKELERDPMAQVEKVYAHFDLPFSEAARAAVSRRIAERTKGRHGKFAYDLSHYGVTADEVRDAFSNYLDAFNVEIER